MSDYTVLKKGIYQHPQRNSIIKVANYIIVSQNGKKYLLLKFANTLEQKLSQINLTVTQIDARGQEMCSTPHKFENLEIEPNSDYILKHSILIEDKCEDFKIRVISVNCGNYAYSLNVKGETAVDYVKSAETEDFDVTELKEKFGSKNSAVARRSSKTSALMWGLAALFGICIFIFTFVQLQNFKRDELTFIDSGIEYEFADSDKGQKSDINIIGYKGARKNVIIPEYIEEHKVIKIKSDAFAGNKNVSDIKVSGSLIIEDGAFSQCINLKTLDIRSVTEIGSDAFSGCKNLVSVNAENLNRIGSNAFADCDNLRTVTISNTEKALELGENVFASCDSLEEVVIAQTILYGNDIAIFKDSTSLKKLTLNNFNCDYANDKNSEPTVYALFGLSFTDSGVLALSDLKLGNLDYVSSNFCYGISTLNSVIIENVQNSGIGMGAFNGCTNLENFLFPVDVTYVGASAFCDTGITAFDASKAMFIGENAFSGCTRLATFPLEGNSIVSFVGDAAFENCENLVSVDFPACLSKIPDALFKGCSSLQSITFSEKSSLIEVGESAFADCSSLLELNLKEGIKKLGFSSFRGCSALKSVHIPGSVADIGLGAFANCSAMEEITLPFAGQSATSNRFFSYIFGATSYASTRFVPAGLKTVCLTKTDSIEANAFYNCDSIENIILPGTVNTVGLGALRGCNGIRELTVPFIGGSKNSFQFLGYIFGAEGYSSNSRFVPGSLSTLKITGSNSIAENALNGCESIREVTLPQGLTTINAYAFNNCLSLRSIILPAQMTTIADNAFAGCYKLFEVWNLSSKLSVTKGSTNSGGVALYALKVYNSLSEDRIAKTNVGDFEFSFVDGTYYLTDYSQHMENINLPENFDFNGQKVTSYILPPYLFKAPSGISESMLTVFIPVSVSEIGENAFASCINLKEVSIASGSPVSEIKKGTFSGCTSLETVSLPSGLQTISGGTFNGCRSLKSITLPTHLSVIGVDAFGGCTSLRVVYNYSSITDIIAGSASHGGVALRAIAVISDASLAGDFEYVTINGINFARYLNDWTVLGCSEGTTALDFSNLQYKGTKIESINIESEVFKYNTSITSVNFGSVKSIGAYAFAECRNLREIIFEGSSLHKISEYAFQNCRELRQVVLPSSVETIETFAFYGCSSLRRVVIPGSFKYMGTNAFYGCSSLYEVYNLSSVSMIAGSETQGHIARYAVKVVNSLSATFDYIDVGNFSFVRVGVNGNFEWFMYKFNGASDLTGTLQLPENFVYESQTVTKYSISNFVFEGKKFDTVIIPESVIYIASDATTGLCTFNKIYFDGSESDWNNINKAQWGGGKVYFKGQWSV